MLEMHGGRGSESGCKPIQKLGCWCFLHYGWKCMGIMQIVMEMCKYHKIGAFIIVYFYLSIKEQCFL